jgi:hypothetical protein
MAYVNIPPNLQDMFYSLADRIAKLESGPSGPQDTADTAQATAVSAQGTASTAYSQAVSAQSQAATALAQANVAYAQAVSSLKPSAYVISNAVQQITSIATNGVTVYSGSSPSSGARVTMNSLGLAGYDSSGNATFSISASTGAANFAGSITGSTITGSTLNISGNFIVNSSGYLTATGATITGSITATSGSFTGSIYASTGTVGGFLIGLNYLSGSGSFFIDSSTGNATFNSINIGYTGIPSWTSSGALTVTTLNTNGNALISGQFEVTGNLQIDTMAVVGSPTSANYNTVLISKTSSGATLGRLYGYNNLSSSIYKENIADFATKNYLEIINKMRPVTFNYKADQVVDPESVIMGMIAEDIDAIQGAQDLVEYAEGKPSAIRYEKIPLFIIKAIQEISNRLDKLEGK